MGANRAIDSILLVAQQKCICFGAQNLYVLMTVRGTTFTLADVTSSRVFSRNSRKSLKIDFEKTRALKVNF
jgi:hypothetical protein